MNIQNSKAWNISSKQRKKKLKAQNVKNIKMKNENIKKMSDIQIFRAKVPSIIGTMWKGMNFESIKHKTAAICHYMHIAEQGLQFNPQWDFFKWKWCGNSVENWKLFRHSDIARWVEYLKREKLFSQQSDWIKILLKIAS